MLLFFLPVVISAQILDDLTTSNLGGRDSVSGTIYLPSRRPAGRGIQVKLNKGGNDASTWTNQDGRFVINGIGNGSYTLTADAGDEYEPVSQRFEVSQPRGSAPQTHFYDIQLRFKSTPTKKPGVIDADLAKAPKKAQQNYLDAREAAAKGDHQAAANKLLEAIDEFPDFALAHAELGLAYMNLNQLEKSDEHLSNALKLKPGSYDPIANRGIVLARLKKYAEAESLLREALKIKDDSAVVHLYLGRALAGQKRLDEAEPEFRAAITMGGAKMVEAHRALANLYLQRGEDQKAISELETYLAANPAAPDASKIRETVKQIKDSLKESRKP